MYITPTAPQAVEAHQDPKDQWSVHKKTEAAGRYDVSQCLF